MATPHQAHNIPWTALGSNLEWRLVNRCAQSATNLHLRLRPTQASDVRHFIGAFVRNIKEHADGERRKYPENQNQDSPVDGEDVVIDDDVARRIMPSVRRMRKCHADRYRLQRADDDPLPLHQRKMAAFLQAHQRNDCYRFFHVNEHAFLSLEIVKILMIHSEMDALLRICARPGGFQLEQWWEEMQCQCVGPDLGWELVASLALESYLLLNILLCSFPETWQREDGDHRGVEARQRDYRRTKAYQRMVKGVTMGGTTSEVHTYPHRQFFGIEDDRFSPYPRYNWPERWGDRRRPPGLYGADEISPCGQLPYEEFLTSEKKEPSPGAASLSPIRPFQPTVTDVAHVHFFLRRKRNMPPELANLILDFADYTPPAPPPPPPPSHPQRQLPIPHDPLHPGNEAELRRYLTFCWLLLVRTEVLNRERGMETNWEGMLTQAITGMFRCRCRIKTRKK